MPEVRYFIMDDSGEVIFTSKWSDLSVSVGYAGTNYVITLRDVIFQRPGNYYVCLETKREKKINLIGKSLLIVKMEQIVIKGPQASGREGSQN